MSTLETFERLYRRGEQGKALLFLSILIALECDAERYEWAKFWRDEIRWLTRPAFEVEDTTP